MVAIAEVLSPARKAEKRTLGQDRSFAGKKILVIDDDPAFQLLCRREFGKDGFEVLLAGSGREGLEIARRGHPDLVVLDIQMPEMDGLLTLVRLLEEQNDLPVVICSAYGWYRDNFLTWAADAYILKTADLEDLRREVGRLVKGKQGRVGIENPALEMAGAKGSGGPYSELYFG